MVGEQTRILGELRTLLASSLQTQNAEIMRKLQDEKARAEHEESSKYRSRTEESKNISAGLKERKW